MHPISIARVCHEANQALRLALGESGDGGWFDVTDEIRSSAIDGVLHALAGATARESHENWLKFKTERGWAYGPVKNEQAKRHPCMVPYDALPAEQQLKDTLFLAIVNALAETP